MAFIRQIIGPNIMIDQIKDSIKSGQPFFIKSYMDYNFDWEDAIKALSAAYNHQFKSNQDPNTSPMMFNGKTKSLTHLQKAAPYGLTFHAADLLNKDKKMDLYKYKELISIHKSLKDISDSNDVYLKLSLNMTENGSYLDSHRDPHHVLITQALGKAKYVIHESYEDDDYGKSIDVSGRKYNEYLMEKNDILFMPKGTIHAINNLTIRGTFIFDIVENINLK